MNKKILAVFAAMFGMVVSAATLTWTGGSTGNLSDASWTDGASQGLTPQSGDKLVFGTAGTFVYDLDAAVWLERLEFSASVTLTGGEISTAVYVSNGGFIVSDASGDARVVTIDVPVKFKTGDMTNSSSVSVKRRQDVLEFTHGVGGVRPVVDCFGVEPGHDQMARGRDILHERLYAHIRRYERTLGRFVQLVRPSVHCRCNG